MTMKFSITVPVYNVEPYLRTCLDSVLRQTYDDYEVVIVNDGATDGSMDVVRHVIAEYAERKIVIIDQENSGLLQARRAGYMASTGEWLLTVDGDDVLVPNALECIAKKIQEYDPQVICFSYSDNLGSNCAARAFADLEFMRTGAGDKLSLLRQFLNMDLPNGMWCKAFNRDLLSKGLDYATFGRLQYGEDLLQTTELFDSASNIVVIPEVLYYYRQNPEGISKSYRREQYCEMKTVRTVQREYVERWIDEFEALDLLVLLNRANLKETYWYVRKLLLKRELSGARSELMAICQDPFFTSSYTDAAALDKLPQWMSRGLGFLYDGKLFLLYLNCCASGYAGRVKRLLERLLQKGSRK